MLQLQADRSTNLFHLYGMIDHGQQTAARGADRPVHTLSIVLVLVAYGTYIVTESIVSSDTSRVVQTEM